MINLATVAYSIMTTTETNDGETAERNVSRPPRPTERTPSAEGTTIQMVTFKVNGTSSKQFTNAISKQYLHIQMEFRLCNAISNSYSI